MWKSRRRRNAANLPLVAQIESLADRVCLSALTISGMEFSQETFEISGAVEMGDSDYVDIYIQFDFSGESSSISADENGNFSFPAEYTNPGEHSLSLYAEANDGTQGDTVEFNYTIEQTTYTVTDLAYADGKLTGAVVDESGAPPEDSQVVVYLDYSYSQDGSESIQASVDANGYFTFDTTSFADPGENTVRLRAEFGSPNDDWVTFTFEVEFGNWSNGYSYGGYGSGGGYGYGDGFSSSLQNGNDQIDEFFTTTIRRA